MNATPTCAYAVEFSNVGKRFDDWVFRNVNLSLPAGRTSAIVGASGCGKTTLLQLINAVYRPDEGSVRVLGEPVPTTDVEPFRRRIGYSVQGGGLFPHLTVAENASLLANLERWGSTAIHDRRRELFELVGLPAELDDRYPHQLSGGQQQRVGLCRALMLKPAMLLLDEPFSAIDPITRADLYRQFEELRDHERVSTVLVTHDMREALRLADHLVIMADGGVLQAAPTSDVAAAPADDFVRSLLSSAS